MTSINIRKLSHSEMDLYRKPLLPETWSRFQVDKDIDTQQIRKALQRDLDRIRSGAEKDPFSNSITMLALDISRMLEKGIDRIEKPMKDISSAIENQGKLEVYVLEKNLANLATIAGAAPMIGFLGTVIGMIVAFHEMASSGGNIDIEMLSKGIYTAMVTTVAGLIVGIIAYVAYNLLVTKVEKVDFLLETTTTDFMDLLHDINELKK